MPDLRTHNKNAAMLKNQCLNKPRWQPAYDAAAKWAGWRVAPFHAFSCRWPCQHPSLHQYIHQEVKAHGNHEWAEFDWGMAHSTGPWWKQHKINSNNWNQKDDTIIAWKGPTSADWRRFLHNHQISCNIHQHWGFPRSWTKASLVAPRGEQWQTYCTEWVRWGHLCSPVEHRCPQ